MKEYTLTEINSEISATKQYLKRPITQRSDVLRALIGHLGEMTALQIFNGALLHEAGAEGVDVRIDGLDYQIKAYMENSAGSDIKLHPRTYILAEGVYVIKFTQQGELLGVAYVSRSQLKQMVYTKNGKTKYRRINKNLLVFKKEI